MQCVPVGSKFTYLYALFNSCAGLCGCPLYPVEQTPDNDYRQNNVQGNLCGEEAGKKSQLQQKR